MSVIEYFQSHIKALADSIESWPHDQVVELSQLIQNHNGHLFFTGIGKNGHVAAKAASTFCSVGIPSFFINPVDAVHGDMSVIRGEDIVIAISKSGETAELLVFLQKVRKKKAQIILVHSHKNNSALKFSNLDIFLAVDKECDHLNIVPTASIVIFTTFLQSVACEIANQKQLTLPQFVDNHPGGSIGKLSNTQ